MYIELFLLDNFLMNLLTLRAAAAMLSRKILENLWTMLKPGGILLLATCSIWPEESERQAASLASLPGAVRLPAPGQLLPISGEREDHDGLFYALFSKHNGLSY